MDFLRREKFSCVCPNINTNIICGVMGWMHNASVAMLSLLAKLGKRENTGETFTFMNHTVHCKHLPQFTMVQFSTPEILHQPLIRVYLSST